MTRKEMRLKCLKVAERLQELGLQKGDTISFICNHHGDLAPLIIGSIYAGLVVNALHTGFTNCILITYINELQI